MRRFPLLAAACGLLAVCGLTAATAATASRWSAMTTSGNRWGKDYLPNYTVYDQDGRELKFYDDVIKGKIVVVDFIFTSCKDICPVVTARLSQAEDRLADVIGKSVFFVSISIDPENDTPEKLKQYSSAFSTGPGWLFLTGKKEEMAEIRFKLGERSKRPSDHRNEIWLGNDGTGEWARDSVFNDIDVLSMAVRNMDPVFRNRMVSASALGNQGPGGYLPTELQGQSLFIKLCASCHTIGHGKRVGPDLAGVSMRREREWLSRYITHPQIVRGEKDPIALELQAKYPAVRMPGLGLAESDTDDVLAYIDAKTSQLSAQASAGDHTNHQH